MNEELREQIRPFNGGPEILLVRCHDWAKSRHKWLWQRMEPWHGCFVWCMQPPTTCVKAYVVHWRWRCGAARRQRERRRRRRGGGGGDDEASLYFKTSEHLFKYVQLRKINNAAHYIKQFQKNFKFDLTSFQAIWFQSQPSELLSGRNNFRLITKKLAACWYLFQLKIYLEYDFASSLSYKNLSAKQLTLHPPPPKKNKYFRIK